MERAKFWASIGISSGWSLTIFGIVVIFNHWAYPLGYFLLGIGVFLFIMGYVLWNEPLKLDRIS